MLSPMINTDSSRLQQTKRSWSAKMCLRPACNISKVVASSECTIRDTAKQVSALEKSMVGSGLFEICNCYRGP